MARAREWSLRCSLEVWEHEHSCWATLTYDDAHLPPTLQPRHLQLWLKRVRKRYPAGHVRFFASGEYGEETHRPHYHAILYGIAEDSSVPQSEWPHGFVRVDHLTPAAISYVAGYCSKKLGWKLDTEERIDYATGESYQWEPPFVRMSRRPGIGGAAREHRNSWRSQAVLGGRPMPVPRFLHAAWRDSASAEEIAALDAEKAARFNADRVAPARLQAGEIIAAARLSITAAGRKKL